MRFVPVLGSWAPVGSFTNTTLQAVSVDSSLTVIFVEVEAVVAVVEFPLNSPLNVVAVTTPV